MPSTFMPDIRSVDELNALQLKGLKWTVAHAYNNSAGYRKKFEDSGITPDDIKTIEDIKRLPFTTLNDLQDGYPFPLLCVPKEDVLRVHASSGTTGKRKILSYTKKDLDDWAHFFARCFEMAQLDRNDRVQICVGYGIWTAGIGFQSACELYGAMAIPTGPGNMDMQCEFLTDMQSTVVCCTASMGLLLAEEVHRRGIRDKIKVKKMIFGSERSGNAMRWRIKELLGLDHMFDIPGMTELYGPGTGLDCIYHNGIHYWADYYILEILDPKTLEPVPEGETGEMVVTSLTKEAVPLIRYRTRDLTRLIPGQCQCGSILPRHDRLLGRSDDMFIYRAVNIYPAHIDSMLAVQPGLGSEYQVIIERGVDGKDYLTLKVERSPNTSPDKDNELEKEVSYKFKQNFMATARIQIEGYGTLPRTQSKSKRVFDYRFTSEDNNWNT